MSQLDDEETAALVRVLRDAIDADRQCASRILRRRPIIFCVGADHSIIVEIS
jgi:hypothetical protein